MIAALPRLRTATAALLLVVVAAPVPAVEMGIHPTKQEFSLSRGQLKRYRFRVTNSERRFPLALRFIVADLEVAEDGSAEIVAPGSTPWSAARWLTVRRESAVVGPGRTIAVPYEIRVPEDATGGGYATILVRTSSPEVAKRPGVTNVNVQIPYILYLTVRGTEVYEGRFVSIRPSTRKAGGPLRCLVTLRNEGNVLIRPFGTLTVGREGEGGASVDLNPGRFAMFPGMSRTFDLDLGSERGAGAYRVASLVDIGGGRQLAAETAIRLK